MGKKTSELPVAAVRRLANVKPDIKIQSDAIQYVIADAENYIQGIFKAALPFMEHRGGTMIMKKDIEAYMASLTPYTK